jgi:hypothetical protein
LVLANWKEEEKLAAELHAREKREIKGDFFPWLFSFNSCNNFNRLLNFFNFN